MDVQHSRYSFTAGNDIAPDGAATVWNEGRYGVSHQDSPGHDSITAYTSEPESGLVKDKVTKFEKMIKIDLLEKMQSRGSKAKNMQPKVRIARALFILLQHA